MEVTRETERVETLFHRTYENFLVLGSAGTGKGVLLRKLVEQLHLRREIHQGDILVEKRAVDFLAGPDSPPSLGEVRAKAADIYKATRELRDETKDDAERSQAASEEILRLLKRCQELEPMAKSSAERAEMAEKKFAAALECFEKAGWFKRLFGKL